MSASMINEGARRAGAGAAARGGVEGGRAAGAPIPRSIGVNRPASRPRGEVRGDITTEEKSTNENQNSAITRSRRMGNTIQETSESDTFEQSGNIDQPIKYRIGSLAVVLLIFTGISLDATELILDLAGTVLGGVGVVIGYLKDAFTLFVIPGIFLLLGAPFWKGRKAKKKMVTMVTSFLISLIPWIGAIMPETTISIAITIYLTRKEDKEKAGGGGQGQISSAAITRLRRMKR